MKFIFGLFALILFIQFTIREESPMLYKYDFQNKNASYIILPKRLKEISGMIVTKDGKLFAHNDEKAIVYQLDVNNGEIIKSFSVGNKGLRGDFEDIAVVDKIFYMITSDGYLLEFPEGKDKGEVKYTQISMAKRNNCEVALEVARSAREILGANGILDEYPVMRHSANLESVKTYEGTHEMHTLIIGEDITGFSAFE